MTPNISFRTFKYTGRFIAIKRDSPPPWFFSTIFLLPYFTDLLCRVEKNISFYSLFVYKQFHNSLPKLSVHVHLIFKK